jgi:hypothetical protein
MKNRTYFFKTGKARFVSNTALLIALSGCVNYANGQSLQITVPPPVVVAVPAVVAQDNYVYYPNYGVYYNTTRRQWAYLDGGAWVSRPAPMGVSAEVLLASPSVKMKFHDSPAKHHAAMAKQFPKVDERVRSDQKATGGDEHGGK